MIKIREVDGCKWFPILCELHKDILPADTLPDFSYGWWWIAFDKNFPVAFAGMVALKQWDNAVYLKRSGVINEYLGRGLQKKLITVRLSKAKKLGMKIAVTDTFDNPYSANNLIAKGFKMYTPITKWATDSACYWHKTLVKN